MPVTELDQVLVDSAVEVLETMFFSTVVGPAEGGLCDSWIAATLSFHGSPSGRFGVRVAPETARRIATAFLGVEEESLSEQEIGEVVCELANMLCGSVLSRIESNARFDLSHPQLDQTPNSCNASDQRSTRALELEEGPLALWLETNPGL